MVHGILLGQVIKIKYKTKEKTLTLRLDWRYVPQRGPVHCSKGKNYEGEGWGRRKKRKKLITIVFLTVVSLQ